MKKEIVINASKNRSRIAIVEDGELVELYVENPDNVRTLGNIVLGRIQNVRPDIRAAFVDVGQKQDAFLHFSDLTDNLAHLLALTGEDVPGLDAPVLSLAPKKQVEDDPGEPDVEDKLDVDSSSSNNKRKRRRGRRGGRRRGRKRGARREEEEEEESAHFIDLTRKTGSVRDESSTKPSEEKATRSPSREPSQSSAQSKSSPKRGSKSAPAASADSNEEKQPEASAAAGMTTIDLTSGPSSTPSSPKSSSKKESSKKQKPPKQKSHQDDSNKDSGRRSRRRGRHRKGNGSSTETRERTTKSGSDADEDASESASSQKASSQKASSQKASSQKASSQKASSQKASSQRRSGRKKEARGEPSGNRSQRKRSSNTSSKTFSNKNLPSPPDLLKRGGRALVKITKEPISNKGSRVSTDISLAGRFLVLVPAADYVAVSKKINSGKERRRLKTLASSLKPDGFGVIVRTVAAGKDAKTLDTDMRLLLDKWRSIEAKLKERPTPPVVLYEDVNMVSSIIRDLFSDNYDRILIDDPKLYRNVRAYVQAVAPQMADNVQHHRSNRPIFQATGIERQVKEAFSKRVTMKSGSYLFVEHTEAMHVIDVNSGKAGRGKSSRKNLLDVNLEAAKEIAKQLRLRDLGGIIVVDFIDLRSQSARRKVFNTLKKEFEKDRAVTKLLPMSDFGLVQITRQRLRPSITASVQNESDGDRLPPEEAARVAGAAAIPQPEREYSDEGEPNDDGSRIPGHGGGSSREAPATPRPEVKPPEALTEELRGWLDTYRKTVDERYAGRPIVVRVHPLLGAYLRRGFPGPLTRWRFKMRDLPFRLEEDPKVDPLRFEVEDAKSGKPLRAKYEG